MSTFYAKRDPKMMPESIRKSRTFLNGHLWVVFRRSLFYCSKTMVQEDLGPQKSMQINEKRMRKQDPKKVCGIERKLSQNGAQIEAKHRQHFEK